ncbi:MAG: RnfH family protein [Burkholderiales bacterium]|jgi:putative ubiquitin-RnfH superfamily antitoxin RatB of RatAB toxin-antitoxin module
MAEAGPLSVEVCWIGVEPPLRVPVTVPAGSTVAQALAASGVAARIAASGRVPAGQGPLDALTVAVLGRRAGPDDRLHDHDRIELLPPLTVDPKVARQRRAEHRRRESGERRWAPDRARSPAAPKPSGRTD